MQDKVSLKNLLLFLLQECGEDRVLLALSDAKAQLTEPDHVPRKKSLAKAKPTIFEVISTISATAHRKTLLQAIGDQFENKTFLPTAHDARIFLEDYGVSSSSVRQRQDAVRPTVKVLSALSEPDLEKILKGSAYRGPSQLGPLSDAIKATGASIRNDKILHTVAEVKGEDIQPQNKKEGIQESESESESSSADLKTPEKN